jgi:tetratricopeptide (TPR) repeat protein
MRIAGWTAMLALLGTARAATAVTNMINTNTCEGEWTQVGALPQVADRLAHWQALAPKCAKSGLYEVRLAALQTMVGRYDEAMATAHAGLALNTTYKKELLSAVAAVALNQGQYADALGEYQALIASYPDYFDGYCGSGAVMLIERRFSEAVRYLNEAAQRAQNPVIYRHLTIAYHQLHQHQQAVEAYDKAYRLNPDIVRDKDATHAAARALMFLGNYRAADGAIKLLLQANPAAGADPEIQQSQQIIQKKLQEEEQK